MPVESPKYHKLDVLWKTARKFIEEVYSKEPSRRLGNASLRSAISITNQRRSGILSINSEIPIWGA